MLAVRSTEHLLMAALQTHDQELLEHNQLRELWPQPPLPWQKQCAEVLGQSRHTQTIALLLDMVNRAAPDVSLAALEALRDFDQALLTDEQRRHVLASIDAAQARPIGQLHHNLLGALRARLRADEGDDK